MYRIRWESLDGSGERGYLRSFADRGEAVAYASEYASAVGTPYAFHGTDDAVCILIAESRRDDYRERIIVSDDEQGSATIYALGLMALVVVPVLTFVVRVFGEIGGVLS